MRENMDLKTPNTDTFHAIQFPTSLEEIIYANGLFDDDIKNDEDNDYDDSNMSAEE